MFIIMKNTLYNYKDSSSPCSQATHFHIFQKKWMNLRVVA